MSDGTELGTMIVENIHPDTESGSPKESMYAAVTGRDPLELTLRGYTLLYRNNGQDGGTMES